MVSCRNTDLCPVWITDLCPVWIATFLLASLSACSGAIGERQGGGGSSPAQNPDGTPVDPGVGNSVSCNAPPPVSQRLWRLSNAQYGSVARDLVHLATGPTVTGGGESSFAFYSADTETVSDVLAFSYAQAAEEVAGRIDPLLLAPCSVGEKTEACAGRFIASFAPRAFRRPATEAEIAALTDVYRAGSVEGYEGGIRLIVQATLQAPSFLYRTELGSAQSDRSILSSYEIASELSFLFLDSGPDDALWSAATSGDLEHPDALAREVDRLLALPAAQDNLSRVVLNWFGAPQVGSKSKAQPGFTEDVKTDLISESRRFIDEVLWKSQQTIADLVTSPRTFVNSRLATLYGIQVPNATPTGFVPFTFPAGQRAGLLTQGSIMSTLADVEETSVVLRGKFIRNEVLCLTPLPPPPGVASRPDIVAALALAKTQRAKAEYRAGNSLCAGCHAGMDPLGLTFEHYDAVGRFRTSSAGQPVDASSVFQSSNFDDDPSLSGRVDGAVDLAHRLTEGPLLTSCAVQKITSYAVGRPMLSGADDSTRCHLDAIVKALPAPATIPALVRAIALSPMFRARRLAGGA